MSSRATQPSEAAPVADSLEHGYRTLRHMLDANSVLLEQLADLEIDLGYVDAGQPRIRSRLLALLDGSLLLADDLNYLTAERHSALYTAHGRIDEAVRAYLRERAGLPPQPLCVPLADATAARRQEVGGKAANLGALRAALPAAVPSGFAITTAAYRVFLDDNQLNEPIRKLFHDLAYISDRDLFAQRTSALRALVQAAPIPASVAAAFAEGLGQFAEPRPERWAVRSSAVGEDGQLSFAGQFASVLNVATSELAAAYRTVLASRYSERAVRYRLQAGFSEVATPMAVLVLPMLEPRWAGVLYTRDPGDPAADRMLVNAVPGLAEELVQGTAEADSVLVSRRAPVAILEQRLATRPQATPGQPTAMTVDELRALVEIGLAAEQHFGSAQDIEWVITSDGAAMVVQARPLRTEQAAAEPGGPEETVAALTQGGRCVQPGRAVGPVYLAHSLDDLAAVPEGAILVVHQATPELTSVLPATAAVIAAQGNTAGHAATLIREWGIPCVFGMESALQNLTPGQQVSLDAGRRKVYAGTLWPELRHQRRNRARATGPAVAVNPLHERVLALGLTDPQALNFAAHNCQSIHDIVRFSHETAVAAMFALGDSTARRGLRRVWRLQTTIPLNLSVLDLGGAVAPAARNKRKVTPEEIASVPFAALWSGMQRPGVSWSGRQNVNFGGLASVFATSMAGTQSSMRELGAVNYLIVGPEYINLNARLAYHFAMVDALITETAENNYVNFRFRGGGAGQDRRDLRAQFLGEVFLHHQFGIDRRGDLVTAWLRRYSREQSLAGLTMIGTLLACARQLDMLMDSPAAVGHYVERFTRGDYEAFG